MWKFIKKYYHWIIAAVALIQLLIYGGALNNFSGYHMIPVTESLEISRTAFSLANSVRSVVTMLSTMFSGALIHRYGYRKTATAGLALAALSYVVYTFMNSYWMLLLGATMIGLAGGFCATAAISRLLNSWFHKYRGTVLGVIAAATGVGSTLLGFIQAWAIENVSWRLSFGIVAIMQFVLALLVFILVRNEPKDMGLRPLGEGETTLAKKEKNVRWAGLPMEQLKKRPAYYLMLLCAFLSCLCVLSTQYNLVPFMQDCGMSATHASKIYGTMMLMLGVIKLGIGALCDTIGPKKVTILCHVGCAVGLILLMILPKTDAALIGALLIYVLASPLTTMMFPLLSVELFGYQAQNQYVGIIMSMSAASNILSSPLANLVRDTTGTYGPVFWGAAICSLALAGVYCILYALASRDKEKLETTQS